MTDFIQIGNVSIATEPLGTGGNAIVTLGNATGVAPMPVGAATASKQDTGNTSLANIDTAMTAMLAELRDDINVAETVWKDTVSGTFYIRELAVEQDNGVRTVTWRNPNGTVATPTLANLALATADKDFEVATALWRATAAGTGVSIGDIIESTAIIDTANTASATVVWVNLTTRLMLAVPPAAAIVVSLSGDANSALQLIGNTSLGSIDTKLPVAVALGDLDPNPTTTTIGSALMGWDRVANQWKRVASGVFGQQPNTSGILNTLPMARYKAGSAYALTDGQVVELQINSNGALRVNDTSNAPVDGNGGSLRCSVAGGVFNSSPPNAAGSSNALPLQIDQAGNLKIASLPTGSNSIGRVSIDSASNAVAATQSGVWTVIANTGITQPLTDIQLRASALAVSTGLIQGITDTQLRANPVAITSASLPLPSGASTDLKQDTMIARLTAISTDFIRSTATPIAQTTLTIAAGATAQFVIPANCKCLTICITASNLVHFTEDGSIPTTNNCWFGQGSKEIWETNIPVGATLNFLATSATVISIQARI